MTRAGWSVVEMDESRISEIQQLFLHVFGHALSEGLWRWKYDEGRGMAVGALSPEGVLLAHYGGTLREIVFFGVRATTVQIGDVMVAREGRATFSHKGPFGMVVDAFLTRHIGHENGTTLGFGFPNARHMRLGEKLGHYVQVDRIFEMSWRLRGFGHADNAAGKGPSVEVLDWADTKSMVVLDRLWERMRDDAGDIVIPLRNGAWFRHRYANHPNHRYLCWWVCTSEDEPPVGVFVLRSHTPSGTGSGSEAVWELMDWIAPLSQTRNILRAAKDVVERSGGGRLMGWFSSVLRNALSGTGATDQEACTTGVTFPVNGLNFPLDSAPALTVNGLKGKWWLTGGDTDFR